MATCTQPLPFLVRLVSIDYYLARPAPKVDVSYAPLEGTAVDQVPVVRIFGSTPSGQKTCVHLHKVSQVYAKGLLACIAAVPCPDTRCP